MSDLATLRAAVYAEALEEFEALYLDLTAKPSNPFAVMPAEVSRSQVAFRLDRILRTTRYALDAAEADARTYRAHLTR